MAIFEKLYAFAGKSFKYEIGKKIKRNLRPLKWAIFGKEGIYETIDIVKRISYKKDKRDILTVFDIGTADGEYSLTFLKSFPRAVVYSFEPQSRSFIKLDKKFKPYKERSKPFKMAFSNKNGPMTFHLMSYADSSSLLPFPATNQTIVGTETVPVMRLDDFIKEKGISHIDFMKIDVESMEREVVEGGMETLINKVDNLFIEISFSRNGIYSDNYLGVLKLVHDAGFTLVRVMTIGDASDFFFSKLI